VAYFIDKPYVKRFGLHLKKMRESKNITQSQLAIDCDFDVSVISRIERGTVNTSISNLRLISKALNIRIIELFDFEED
jgi:transcriptional regulator with XRE-family HTH domain